MNPQSFKPFRHLTFEGAWPRAVAFVGNGRLVAGNEDGQLFLWDLSREPIELTEEEKKRSERNKDRQPNVHPIRRLDGHTNGISRLVTTGENGLISASYDHTIRQWDLAADATGEAEAVLDIEDRRQRARRDKKNEEAIFAEPGIKVQTQGPAHVFGGHADWVVGCSVSANSQRVVTGDDSNVTIVWDFPARREIRRWNGHKMCGVVSTAVSPDGQKCFVAEHRMRRGDFDRPPAQAKIFALDGGEIAVDLMEVQFPDVKERDNSYGYGEKWQKWVGHGFVCSAFSPDGKLLAVGQGGEIGKAVVHLIEVETGKMVRSVSEHEYGVTDVKFSADGKFVLTTGRDTTLRICQTDDGKEVAKLGNPRGGQFKDWTSALAISPDERRLAAADIAGMIHVWEAQ